MDIFGSPLAICIPTPTNEAESEDEKGGASVGASRCSRFAVIAMCSAMLFLGVGAEIGYGTWVATYSLEKLRVSEVDAAYLSSSYYVGFLLGRLLAVPASTRLSPTALLYISFAGGTLALAPLLPGAAAALAPIVEPVTLAIGVSAALGLFIAPIFAASMSVGSVAGLPMTSRQMSIQVCWAVVGEMVVTVVVGARMAVDVDEFAVWNLCAATTSLASGLHSSKSARNILGCIPAFVGGCQQSCCGQGHDGARAGGVPRAERGAEGPAAAGATTTAERGERAGERGPDHALTMRDEPTRHSTVGVTRGQSRQSRVTRRDNASLLQANKRLGV